MIDSWKNKFKKVLVKTEILVVAFCMLLFSTPVMAAGENKAYGIEQAEQCLVKIYSGYDDGNGDFAGKALQGTGIVIAKNSSVTYIVTTASNIVEPANNKTPLHKVLDASGALKNLALQDQMSSKDKTFVILTAENMKKVEAARVSDMEDNQIGNPVWSMGFQLQDNQPGVTSRKGEIENNAASIDGTNYIQTTARSTKTASGGALVSDDGYLLGMMDNSRAAEGAYYALSITYITEVLESNGIEYESEEKDALIEELKSKIESYQTELDQGYYKRSSSESLEEALRNAEELLNGEEIKIADLNEAEKQIDESSSMLKRKTPTIIIIARVLLGIIFILLMFFIKQALNLSQVTGKFQKGKKPKTKRMPDQGKEIVGQERFASELASSVEEDDDLTWTQPKFEEKDEEKYEEIDEEKDEATRSMYITIEAQLILPDKSKYFLDKKRAVRIGRKPGINDIVLGEYVSREHAVVILNQNRHYLKVVPQVDKQTGETYAPKNGTFVNGSPVELNEYKTLSDGDQIKLGPEIIIYKILNA